MLRMSLAGWPVSHNVHGLPPTRGNGTLLSVGARSEKVKAWGSRCQA
jgi:hypothetical protein